jgi:hypothetical protein
MYLFSEQSIRSIAGASTATAGAVATFAASAYELEPDLYLIARLGAPKPFLFLDFAVTLTVLPFFIPLIVQVVFLFFAVQDFPPAEIFVLLITAPPLSAPNVTTTVKLTLPFLTGLLVIDAIVGALGLTTFLAAAAGGAANTTTKSTESSEAKRFML